jgi:RND family efflux transporter MFP subunit
MTTGRSIALLSALLAAGCGGGPHASAPPADGEAAPRTVMAAGRVEGWREADVASKLPGRIRSFEVAVGDEVEAGAAVARLEDRDLVAREHEAAARADEAERALARARALRAAGVLSASELDRAEAARATSRSALEEARALADYATVRAPFRGTVVRKWKEAGEGVSSAGPPDPLLRLADLSRLKVTAEVPETDVGAVTLGQEAIVTAEAWPDVRFPAVVSQVGLAAGRKRVRSDDPRARQDEKVIEVELALGPEPRLRTGMTVEVAFGGSVAR